MQQFELKHQQQICEKYHSPFEALKANEMIAVALGSIGKMPIYGIRNISTEHETVSWFIYCGEFSEQEDFFQPIHAEHLKDKLAIIIPYLALAQGYRFIIDDQGYEDVWFENKA